MATCAYEFPALTNITRESMVYSWVTSINTSWYVLIDGGGDPKAYTTMN